MAKLNWIERKLARLVWRRLEKRVSFLKRWTPIIGSGMLVLVVVLRLLGQTEFAQSVESLGAALGITTQSPVSLTELAAAVSAGTGIVLKVVSQIKK